MNTTDDILWRAMVYCGPSANRRHCRTLASARYCSRTRTRLRGETVMAAAAAEKPTKDKLLSTLDDIEVLSRFVFTYSACLDVNNFLNKFLCAFLFSV